MSGSTNIHNPKDLFRCWQWRLTARFEVTCSTNKTPVSRPAHLTRKLTWPTAQFWLPSFPQESLESRLQAKGIVQAAAGCSMPQSLLGFQDFSLQDGVLPAQDKGPLTPSCWGGGSELPVLLETVYLVYVWGALGKDSNCEQAVWIVLSAAAPSCLFPWATPRQAGTQPPAYTLNKLQCFRDSTHTARLQQVWTICTCIVAGGCKRPKHKALLQSVGNTGH